MRRVRMKPISAQAGQSRWFAPVLTQRARVAGAGGRGDSSIPSFALRSRSSSSAANATWVRILDGVGCLADPVHPGFPGGEQPVARLLVSWYSGLRRRPSRIFC